ncbi:MAG TPA: CHASE domain-containing protein [Opitutaceae bacterium]|nr:CHASE domain-containing protein [Opitutaceae bacterium]
MKPEPAGRSRLLTPRLLVGFVVAAGLILSYLSYRQVVGIQHAAAEQAFYRRADVRHALTREILSYYEAGLFGLRNLFVGDDAVSREEFLHVARDIRARYEGISALEWVPTVSGRDRDAFELATSRELGKPFHFLERTTGNTLGPDPERTEYYPITYIEPIAGNEPALGLDLIAGHTSGTLELARRENRMALSQALELVQGQRGVVMTWPVYQKRGLAVDPRGSFLGFTQVVFRIGELFEQTQKRDPTPGLDTLYLDRSATEPASRVLYYQPSEDGPAPTTVPTEEEFRAGVFREHVIAIGGREWLVLYRPSAAWMKAQTTPLPIVRFCGGFVITGLLASLMYVVTRRTAGIEALVTERTAELIESRRQTENLLSQLPGMAFRCLADEKLTPLYVSSGVLELTGYTADDFLSRRVCYEDLMEPEDRLVVNSTTLNAVALRQPFEIEYRVRHRDGSVKWVLDRGAGVFAEDGRLMFIEGLAVDITARKQAEAEKIALERKLLEGQKLESLGVLAGGIAHDFNNLLTTIMGNASLARLDLPEASPLQKNLRQIETTSLRAAELCQQMLAYSGRGRFVVERVDLGSLVEGTVPLLNLSVGRRATFRLDLAAGLPPVMADATQIRQIVMNLVMNAAESLGEGDGEIALATGMHRVGPALLALMVTGNGLPPGDYVFLKVTDHGCGMSPETLARIFDPFFTTKFAGRGLGLAAVLGIVRSHQGALRVESSPGRGTTFTLFLPPCDGEAASGPSKMPSAVPWHRSGVVLVADDEAEVRAVAAEILEKLGFTVVTAVSGHEAIAYFERDPDRYDLLLLDLTMPGLSGEETLRRLRARRPGLRVLLMSGYSESEAQVHLADAATGFLQKPFTVGGLIAKVRAILET